MMMSGDSDDMDANFIDFSRYFGAYLLRNMHENLNCYSNK